MKISKEIFKIFYLYRNLVKYFVFEAFLELAAVASIIPLIWYSVKVNRDFSLVLISIAVLLFIIVKNLLLYWLSITKNIQLLSIYKIRSKEIFSNYLANGFLDIKTEGASKLSYNTNALAFNYVFSLVLPIFQTFTLIVIITLIVIVIFFFKPLISFILLLIITPFTYFYLRTSRSALKSAGIRENSARRDISKVTIETFRGYHDIILSNAVNKQKLKFEESLENVYEARLTIERLRSRFTRSSEILLVFTLLAAILFYKFNNQITNSEDFAFSIGILILASIKMLPSLKTIITNYSSIQSNLHIVDSISIEQNKKSFSNEEGFETINFNNSLEFHNLSFNFLNGEKLIENFNYNINKGDWIGIQGESGVGKSTFLNLLTGLYKPVYGEIYVDSKELSNSNIKDWQSKIGYVSQEATLFSGTLKDNIVISSTHESIDSDLLNKVIRISQLNKLIEKLPQGIETDTGEWGTMLSGGERQRVAIARALYKNAKILVMDEPSSALDSESESEILIALENLKKEEKDLTIIIVSHRESILKKCNKILNL